MSLIHVNAKLQKNRLPASLYCVAQIKRGVSSLIHRTLFNAKEELATMESPFKGKTGLRRVLNATGYSIEGLKAAYAYEDAFRQETWLAIALSLVSLFLPVSLLEHALLISSLILVLIVELINSAIEAAIDRIGLESHRLSKRAKDIGSAAVMLSLINVLVIWGLALYGVFA